MPDNSSELMQALHDEHAAALWGFCLHLTHGDRDRAEDLAQETLVRAWRHPEVLDQENGSVRGWLFTVARRLLIDDWRSAHSRHEVARAEPPEQSTTDRTDEVLDAWLVADALSLLSREHREVIVACYYRGMSVAEASQHLGVPTGTVKSRTHYALRALRLALQERGVTS
ncbi:MAG: sigma-70 family RNA polymerase sigma factor [Nocardioides sp.]